MKTRSQLKQGALLGTVILLLSLPAFSQSCALCYTQAASAGRRMIQALRSGIIVMMVPPACMSVAISIVAYRKRNQFKSCQDDELEDQW